jgi:hypothetical protein
MGLSYIKISRESAAYSEGTDYRYGSYSSYNNLVAKISDQVYLPWVSEVLSVEECYTTAKRLQNIDTNCLETEEIEGIDEISDFLMEAYKEGSPVRVS